MMMAADRKLTAAKNSGRSAVHWDVAKAFGKDLISR
jgi:PleD family two-component response regulator